MSIEAMKQAWEAEQKANPHTAYNSWCRGYEAALRTAIEQAEKQEPVAWGVFEGGNLHDMFFTQKDAEDMARLKGDHTEVRPLCTPPAAPVQEPVAVVSVNTLAKMFQYTAADPTQWRHHWARGWNDAIRQAMDYTNPPAAPYRAVKTVHEGKPVYVSEPAAPVQEPDLSGLRPDTQKTIKGWIADGTFFERAIGALQEQERENMRLEKLVAAQRQWVGLTEEQRRAYDYLGPDMALAINEIEAMLREKNGGQA